MWNANRSCFWLIGSSATSMRTASLRWLSGWRNPGKAPQHWSKRWVHFFLSLQRFRLLYICFLVRGCFMLVQKLCYTYQLTCKTSYLWISPVAVRPDHSHLPATAVQEAEGETCPPLPWANSLQRLLLSSAARSAGQASPLLSAWTEICFLLFTVCLLFFCCCRCIVAQFLKGALLMSRFIISSRGTSFTSVRTRTPSSWVLWICPQTTLMTVHGSQEQPILPRVSGATQTVPVAKTW